MSGRGRLSFILHPSTFSLLPSPPPVHLPGPPNRRRRRPRHTSVTGVFRIVKGGDFTSGGQEVYAQTNDVRPDINGVFSVTLGSLTPIPLSAIHDGTSSNRFIEAVINSETNLPRQQLLSVPYAMTAIGVVPPGSVLPYAGITASIPAGWLPCDGRLTNTVDHPRLFAALQYTYGGTGAQFRLPDMRGRVPMGAGQGSGLSNRTLSQTAGAESHSLTTAQMPAHNHGGATSGMREGGSDWPRDFAGGAGSTVRWSTANTLHASGFLNVHTHGISIDGGGGLPLGQAQPHNIMQPSLVLNYIIKD